MSWKGRVGQLVQQVRLFYCPNSLKGHGLREFVGNNYDELKTLNPTTPFLIRARDGAKTELWVKYDFGQEEMRNLDDASAGKVEETFRELVLLGEKKKRFDPHPRGDYIVDAYYYPDYDWNNGLINPHAPKQLQ